MARTRQVKLSLAEIEHLLHVLAKDRREGSYYGPKEQYEQRSIRLTHKLKEALRFIEKARMDTTPLLAAWIAFVVITVVALRGCMISATPYMRSERTRPARRKTMSKDLARRIAEAIFPPEEKENRVSAESIIRAELATLEARIAELEQERDGWKADAKNYARSRECQESMADAARARIAELEAARLGED